MPGGPIIPTLGVVSCAYLMIALTVMTWVRFLVWLDFGMIIYWFYGRTHSQLANKAEAAARTGLENLSNFLKIAGYMLAFNGFCITLLGVMTEWGVTTEELAKWHELDVVLNRWFGLHINPQIADTFGLTILAAGVVAAVLGFVLGRRSRRSTVSARLLDGHAVAAAIRDAVLPDVRAFTAAAGRPPGLGIVLVGDNPSSEIHCRNKVKAGAETGLWVDLQRLPATARLEELLALVERLNASDAHDGILVQAPLPEAMGKHAAQAVFDAIDPGKDVDGFHPANVGRLVQGRPHLVPARHRASSSCSSTTASRSRGRAQS